MNTNELRDFMNVPLELCFLLGGAIPNLGKGHKGGTPALRLAYGIVRATEPDPNPTAIYRY